MNSNYLISRKWALTSRIAVTDETGTPQFEVRGRFALSRTLSMCDATGAEVAVISRRGLGRRYGILAGGQETTVAARGFFGRRYDIDSPGGPLQAQGNFSGSPCSHLRSADGSAAVLPAGRRGGLLLVTGCPGQGCPLDVQVFAAPEPG